MLNRLDDKVHRTRLETVANNIAVAPAANHDDGQVRAPVKVDSLAACRLPPAEQPLLIGIRDRLRKWLKSAWRPGHDAKRPFVFPSRGGRGRGSVSGSAGRAARSSSRS